jgi:uncharacterized protein (TIGR02678 family)
MPEQRTDGHVTLLVAEYLSRRDEATLDELRAFVRQAAAEHRDYWRKGVTEPGAEAELLATALEKLTALRLVTVDGSSVRSRPAIARFALDEPVIRPSRPAPPKPAPPRPAPPRPVQPRKASDDAASTLF